MSHAFQRGAMFGVVIALAALVGSAGPAHAQSASRPAPRDLGVVALPAIDDPGDSLYQAGRAAMNAGDFRKAADLFKALVDKYPKSTNADNALYWQGYSLFQLGNTDRSSAEYAHAVEALDAYDRAAGTNASMKGDAADLRTRIRAAQAKLGDADAAGDIARSANRLAQPGGCSGSQADEDTRMAALEGLLGMNADDAVPILKDVLKQRTACRADLRRKAVFLLSQKNPPDVTTTLLDVARNDPDMNVRSDAVFWLSQTHSPQVVPVLDSIVFSAGDEEIRKKAVMSLGQQLDNDQAVQALHRAIEDEGLPVDLRTQAIFWLGNSSGAGNLDYLKSAFKKTNSNELRSHIIQAVANSSAPDAASWLLDVARDKSYDVDTRKNAIFWAGQHTSVDLNQLATLYSAANGEPDIQKQVLFVYSQRQEPAALDKLMDVAKSDPNVEMRKQALFWIGQKNDARAKQFIRDLISKP